MSFPSPLIFITLGHPSTGKTTLLHQFINQDFITHYKPTNDFTPLNKSLSLLGHKVNICIWDAPSLPTYPIKQLYYSEADGVLLIYDITNRSSFEAIPQWLATVRGNCKDGTPVVLLGNKLDLGLGDRRQVLYEEGRNFTGGNGMVFMEVSARDYWRVRKVVEILCWVVRGVREGV